jgi:hypothetical protein
MKTVLQPFGRCRVVGGGADGFDGKRTHVLNVRAGFDVTAIANVIGLQNISAKLTKYYSKNMTFVCHKLCSI